MADLNIRDKFFDDLAKGARWDVGVSIARGNPLPLDANSVFESYEDLETYAGGVLAYPGQIVAVVNADSTGIYYLDQEKAIKPVGVIPAGDELSIDMDESDVISLHNYGKVFYKYIPENEETGAPARYEKTVVSADAPWVAGLEPKVVTEEGKLVLGWFEPNPTTIEGVNDQVTAVQGTVTDLVDSVGAPSADGSPATGLYKEVEDVQEDVEELVNTVGNSDDALSENVQTVWAHVNNHTERIEVLEAIDHDLLATKEALAAEADRADKAEKANAAAIKAIADDYLKGADKQALEGSINGIADRVGVIEGDYLKAADIADMATDAEVEAAVKAEADRAKAAEKALQDQIDTIFDNPDVEGAINSINEFTKYVEDHGEIADGFRADIDQNKADIAAEVKRAGEAETALDERIATLEAINHEAYIAADTALKNELNGEIAKKADKTALEAAVEALEGADEAINNRLDAALGENGTVAQAIAAAEGRAATDATNKANAAKEAAIADAAGKYATTGALGALETALDERIDALEAHDHSTYATKNELKTTDDKAKENAEAIKELAETVEGIVSVGGEANVITKVKVNGVVLDVVDKAVDVTVPTKFSDLSDDSGFDARITAAKTQADKGVSDAAAADAKAVVNAEEIGKHATRLGILEEAKADHLERIAALETHDEAHTAEYNALNEVVTGHGTTLAGWEVSKANTTDLNAAVTRIAANETAVAANANAIAGANAEIAKKANAADLENYYTKA